MRATDVVVVGAGAAGMAVSLEAARRGLRVALLERRPDVGGLVAHSLIHTIGGLYDSAGELLNAGLPEELAARLTKADDNTRKRKIGRVWVLNVAPSVYRSVVREWLGQESSITVYPEVRDLEVTTTDRRIGATTFSSRGERIRLQSSAFVDCTGDASALEAMGEEFVFGDREEALAGLIFSMRGVDVERLAFPRSIAVHRAIRAGVVEGRLPAECSHVWIDTGVHPDEVYVKLSFRAGPASAGSGLEEARERLVAFLRVFPAFEHARVVEVGQPALRGGKRGRGVYRLTGDDVRGLRRFADAACACAWPIEYWDPVKGVQLQYLKDDGSYEIPLRSLQVAGVENVWVAGKCFSGDHLAQASARVSGCCWAMGQAVGKAISNQ